jgi:hypothetical protein
MPRIGNVNGLVIWMYRDDHNPPHVHVATSRGEALVDIRNCAVMKGHLSGPDAKAVAIWIRTNAAVLFAKWEELQS